MSAASCRAAEEPAPAPSGPPRGEAGPSAGPLTIHPDNRRYLTDGSGRAILLAGSHTWNNFQDWGSSDPPPEFDYDAYLDLLAGLGHNFIRLWSWENARWWTGTGDWQYAPLPYRATGPADSEYGGRRFDLRELNQAYFDRLRQRVIAARDRGIYVSVMLFQGWSVDNLGGKGSGQPWRGHPFHRGNNVNGIDGDPGGTGQGTAVHTLGTPDITSFQEAYVRRVVETVNDLDNVLFEISNESPAGSTAWQYHMIDYVHRLEAEMPKQHLVGMTFQWPDGRNEDLFDGPADWISVGPGGATGDYKTDPPAADGKKVIVSDTDHLWGIGGDAAWVLKSFFRGLHPIFMDGEPTRPNELKQEGWRQEIRVAMGEVARYADLVGLAGMVPDPRSCSTGYCLANPGTEYLFYQPASGPFTARLDAGSYAVEWYDPASGRVVRGETLRSGDAEQEFRPPAVGQAVLHLRMLG